LPARVLIVDDHEGARNSVRDLLRHHSIPVCGEVENGIQAIEKVKALHPDVVLLDVNMPVMNGFEAAYEIRRIAPATKIVFFTIHGDPEYKAAAKLFGIDEFIDKATAGSHLVPALKRLTSG